MKINFIKLVIVFLFSGSCFANDLTSCKLLQFDENSIYTVYTNLHKATHIVLPEEMIGSAVIGNSTLWTLEGKGKHIFVKPNSISKEGLETTLTAIGKNASYEFILKHAARNGDTCVKIVPYKVSAERKNIISKANSSLDEIKKQVKIETMRLYRNMVYTRYNITTRKNYLKNLITDVWDDGRFTYLRIHNSAFGVLTIKGISSEMLNYKYDSETKIYQVTGIYDKMILSYDNNNITVERKDRQVLGV